MMDRKEFMETLRNAEIDSEKVALIQGIYKTELPEELQKLVSLCGKQSQFIGEDLRLLTLYEVSEGAEEYEVNFVGQQLIPVFDCFDNDFIVFDCSTRKWSKYNIIDQVLYRKGTKSILDII